MGQRLWNAAQHWLAFVVSTVQGWEASLRSFSSSGFTSQCESAFSVHLSTQCVARRTGVLHNILVNLHSTRIRSSMCHSRRVSTLLWFARMWLAIAGAVVEPKSDGAKACVVQDKVSTPPRIASICRAIINVLTISLLHTRLVLDRRFETWVTNTMVIVNMVAFWWWIIIHAVTMTFLAAEDIRSLTIVNVAAVWRCRERTIRLARHQEDSLTILQFVAWLTLEFCTLGVRKIRLVGW
mmetsp:Transcript_150659/g.262473  ORF Transcript_150659/g.262473 Transcript_150659/m.262473 type:complete len:238 (-) Transcript_150659:2379-3092(-)